jgi:hypothetical protein
MPVFKDRSPKSRQSKAQFRGSIFQMQSTSMKANAVSLWTEENSYTRLLCGKIHYVWNERHLKLTWGFHNLVFKVFLDRNQICIDCIVCTAQAAHCWFGPTTVFFLPIYVLSSGWCGLLLSCVWFVFYFDCVVVFSCCQCFDGFYLVAVTCSLHTQVLSFGFTDLLWPVTCYSLLLYPPLFLILCHRNILYLCIAVPRCAKYALLCMRWMRMLGVYHISASVSLGVHWAARQQTFEIMPTRIPKALRVCSLLYVHEKIDL